MVEGRPIGGSAENHVVHVFVCTRRRHARALALSLAHAFNDAYQVILSRFFRSIHCCLAAFQQSFRSVRCGLNVSNDLKEFKFKGLLK